MTGGDSRERYDCVRYASSGPKRRPFGPFGTFANAGKSAYVLCVRSARDAPASWEHGGIERGEIANMKRTLRSRLSRPSILWASQGLALTVLIASAARCSSSSGGNVVP